MDEGVVEGGQDVAHSKHIFGLFASTDDGGSVVGDLLFLGFTALFSFGVLLSFLLGL